MAAHEYWRIKVTDVANDLAAAVGLQVCEIEMRASLGGADECSGGTPTYSSPIDGVNYAGGFAYSLATRLFDNDHTTHWTTDGFEMPTVGSPIYLNYHFAAPVDIAQLAVTGAIVGATTTNRANAPKDFVLQYSDDDATYFDALTVTGQLAWGANETRTFNAPAVINADVDVTDADDTLDSLLANFDPISDTLDLADGSPDASTVQRLFDSMELDTGSPTYELVTAINAALTLADTHTALGSYRRTISDALALTGTVRSVHLINLSATLALGQTLNTGFVLAVADSLALTGQPVGIVSALALLVDALTIEALPNMVQEGVATDTLALSQAIASQASYLETLVADLAFSDTAGGYGLYTVLLEDSVSLDETVTPTRHLIASIQDGLDFSIGFDLGDASYVAYSMNAASKGLTSYTNFNFNSLAVFNGRTYAAGTGGLYRLGGTTDDGEEIPWRIRTGLTNLGTGRNKGLDAVYLGYTATGRVALKCIVVAATGEKKAYWYELTDPVAGAAHPGRILVGRGLKAVYWGFEMSNIDEGSIELDIIELHPVVFEGRLP